MAFFYIADKMRRSIQLHIRLAVKGLIGFLVMCPDECHDMFILFLVQEQQRSNVTSVHLYRRLERPAPTHRTPY